MLYEFLALVLGWRSDLDNLRDHTEYNEDAALKSSTCKLRRKKKISCSSSILYSSQSV